MIKRLSWILLWPFMALASLTQAAELEVQREMFKAAWPDAEKGIWTLSLEQEVAMADYPLYPDLRGAWLRAQSTAINDAELEQFVRSYSELNVAHRLLQRRARSFAANGDHQRLVKLVEEYDDFDLIAGNTSLHCQIHHAHIESSDAANSDVVESALNLWTVGKSQPKECDKVFAWLENQHAISPGHYRQRIELAIEQRQFRLAAWLARSAGDEERNLVDAWKRMARDPASELNRYSQKDSAVDPAMLAYGMRLLAFADLELALQTWDKRYRTMADDIAAGEIESQLALRAARRDHPAARSRLAKLATPSDLTVAWAMRLALREQDWDAVIENYPQLSENERKREVWAYWRARAELEAGDRDFGVTSLEVLSETRGYFGFLAADLLKRPYQLGEQAATADEALIDRIATDPDMIRARELFEVGLFSEARSEWNDFVSKHDARVLVQATVLAHRWGWHSRAISTAAKSGLLDALDIRFPRPWPKEFEHHAGQAGIPLNWAYGIARSESLYMSDVRSSAGAIGLMQLMPATGRQVGRRMGRPISGWHSLVDPDTNIALGTRYLGEMLERFDQNPVLATAAYNAGPHRVAEWLPEQDDIDAEIWIATIPFRETRRYLRRVLEAQVIFGLQQNEATRLSTLMPPVVAPAQNRVASQRD